MSKLNILIVEGNLKEENLNFQKEGIQTHTESLKDSLSYFKKNFKFDVINPSSDEDLQSVKSKLPGDLASNVSSSIYNRLGQFYKAFVESFEDIRSRQKELKITVPIWWRLSMRGKNRLLQPLVVLLLHHPV